MADENSEHNDNTPSTVTSPPQQKEDEVGGSTHVFSDTRDIAEVRDKCDDVMSLLQSSSPENVDGRDQVIPVARGSGPAQACNVTTGRFHNRDENQQCPIARPVQCTTISKNPSTHPSISESVQAAPFLGPVTPISPVPPQAQTAASLSPIPENAALAQPLSLATAVPSLPQAAHPRSRLAKLIPLRSVPKDQVISDSGGTGVAQSSNASAGTCLNRFAIQARPTIAPTVQSRIDPSFPTAAPLLTYPTQTAPLPPQAQAASCLPSSTQTVDFRPTLSPTYSTLTSPVQTACPGSDLAQETPPLHISQGSASPTIFPGVQSGIHTSIPASPQAAPCLANPTHTGAFLQSLTRTSQTARPASHLAKETAHLNISQDFDRKHILRKSMCGLCRKDMVILPGVPFDVTELPCGHRFHTRCLQRITSADRSEKPPCIPCGMRERVPVD